MNSKRNKLVKMMKKLGLGLAFMAAVIAIDLSGRGDFVQVGQALITTITEAATMGEMEGLSYAEELKWAKTLSKEEAYERLLQVESHYERIVEELMLNGTHQLLNARKQDLQRQISALNHRITGIQHHFCE